MKGCIKQKIKSQEALYRAYYAYSMSICLRYASNRDEAVDIMNDAFIKVFKNIKTYDKSKPFTTWLRAILINTAIDSYRENVIYKQHITYFNSDTDNVIINSEIANNLELEDIMFILSGLPEQQRLIFNLYEIEGYSHKEIAIELNISENTSRAYLSIAKNNIRKQYIRYNKEALKPLDSVQSNKQMVNTNNLTTN